jgi:hypothetical protein
LAASAAAPPRQSDGQRDESGLQALAQAHLDSAFMRREVTDLARALDQAEAAAAQAQAAAQQALAAARQALAERDAARAALASQGAALQALGARHARLTARLQSLLRWLPAPLRARLIERGRRALDA